MIGFLCKAYKNVAFLKCFIFDLILTSELTMPFYFQNLILILARIWPESLNWPACFARDHGGNSNDNDDPNTFDFETSTKKNPILCAVIFVVKEAIHKNNKILDEKFKVERVKHADFSAYYVHVCFFIGFRLYRLYSFLYPALSNAALYGNFLIDFSSTNTDFVCT
jgi:hypothetical protein